MPWARVSFPRFSAGSVMKAMTKNMTGISTARETGTPKMVLAAGTALDKREDCLSFRKRRFPLRLRESLFAEIPRGKKNEKW